MEPRVDERLLCPPSAGLMVGPTPLEMWSNLSRVINAPVLAKRDDLSVVGLGGNKVRKLDLVLGAALRSGTTDVITVGGVQSNHCRITAAACARLGLACHVFLRGDDPAAERAGNLLLDELFGASVHICNVVDFNEIDGAMFQLATQLKEEGRAPMVVPLGGSTPLGILSYVLAARELRDQLDARSPGEPNLERIIVAAGTGGTLAGIALGCSHYLPDVSVVGVSVSRTSAELAGVVENYRSQTLDAFGYAGHLDNLVLIDEHVGAGYTIPNPGTGPALRLLARTEGVLADLTYTGKALEYLMSHPTAASDGSTLFWHTGGSPELFARPAHAVLGSVNGPPS